MTRRFSLSRWTGVPTKWYTRGTVLVPLLAALLTSGKILAEALRP